MIRRMMVALAKMKQSIRICTDEGRLVRIRERCLQVEGKLVGTEIWLVDVRDRVMDQV